MAKFDDVLFEINDFGRYQRLRYVLICLAGLLPPITTYINSFLVGNPNYSCKVPINENSTLDNYEIITEKCSYSMNGTKYVCTSWEFDKKYYTTSLTEEWNLVCDHTFYQANIQTVYFSGYLVGSLVLGNLADLFGRRPVMLSSFIFIIIGALGSAFGPQKSLGFTASYIIYIVSRFIMACGTRGINETGYVLALELVGSKRRTYAGIVFEHFFSLGQLILVFVAYFVRDWRTLAILFIIPCVPFISYFFILPESPRWLISKNRQDEAFEILENVAKSNKTHLSKDLWEEFLNESKKSKDKKSENFLTLIKSLIKYPKLMVLLLTMFLNWIVNNFVFYGVGLRSNNLGVNPYLSFAISAGVELLAYGSTLLIIDKLGRKKTYFAFLFGAGVSLFSIVFINNLIASVVLAMIGKFSISASYAILRLYSNEVFPTSIRNGCMGACSTVSRLGVIVAPFINSLGDRHWKSLPFLVFGIFGILSSFTTILLPETLHKSLPENLEEANKLNSFNFVNKKPKELNVNTNQESNKESSI